MSAMARRALPVVFFAALLTAAFLPISLLAQGQDVQQHLRDKYKGKTFVLRGFYSKNSLHYDASGTIVGSENPGDWMSDGFIHVEAVRFSHHQMVIEARRLLVIQLDGKQFQVLRESEPEQHEVKIEVDLDISSVSAEQADDALSRILLTSHDNLEDLVSDYWKPCVREAALGQSQRFSFSPELSSIPGVAGLDPKKSGAVRETSDARSLSCSTGQTHRRGVAPRVIYQEDPNYSDEARRAGLNGTVTLMLVVNEAGIPENIHIVRPFGHGLDAKALSCVRKWKFKPAEEDGRPVPVEIAVEVEFHLY
jgi:TonB family protein